MAQKKRFLQILLLVIILIPIFLISSLFLPGVQKHLVKTQLHPWIDQINVDSIHITPFSIQIKNLSFKHEAIDIHIGHLDSEFSLLGLLRQRIKVEKFILDEVKIDDATVVQGNQNNHSLLFPGLFPYLNTGYIYDIDHLSIKAHYRSDATGPLHLAVAAESVNEQTSNPVTLELQARELRNIPDIREIFVNASIALNQHSNSTVDSKLSRADIKLVNDTGLAQFVTIQLNLKQLPPPEAWESFPFDRHHTHYLKKVLNPESIQLHISHKNEAEMLLSDLQFNGEYDGNEGVISGIINAQTDKAFLQLFKSLKLPKIDSVLKASFQYNTRTLDGHIDLSDELQITDYATADKDSLPEQIQISNHLTASLNNRHLLINHFLLNMLSDDQEYINMITHKPLSVNLNQPSAFFDQRKSDLLSININQLPLNWFSDLLPEYEIEHGMLDTAIKLSLANNTLTLKSDRPLSLSQVSIFAQSSNQNESINKEKTQLLRNQNLEANFELNISQEQLSLQFDKLALYTQSNDTKHQQSSNSLTVNLKQPLAKEFLKKPMTLSSKGQFNISQLIKIPLLNTLLHEKFSDPLSESLPRQLAMEYDLSLQKNSSLWTMEAINLKFNSAGNKKILVIKTNTPILFKEDKNNILLQTEGKLLSARVNQFDLNWLAPLIKHYAKPYTLSGQLNQMDLTVSAKQNNEFALDIDNLYFSRLQAFEDTKPLFKNLSLNSQIYSQYSNNSLKISYPSLTLKQNKTLLLKNSGVITLTHLDDKNKQTIAINGKLNAVVNHLMKLDIVRQYTPYKITRQSLLNADYKIHVNEQQLTIKKSELLVSHPQSKGLLAIKTHKPVLLSLQDNKYNFSQDGHLSFKLTNFDIKPYESIFPDIPISFEHANGHIDLIQRGKKQTITLQQPIKVHNIYYKDKTGVLLNPFDLALDFSVTQTKNISDAQLHLLSVIFLDKKEKALDLKAQIKLDLDKTQPVSELDSQLELSISQWLKQPGIIPHNTLKQGSMSADISIDTQQKIKHQWLINDLTDQQDKKIVESITIDGDGKLESLSSIKLNFPVIMKSLSGTSHLDLQSHVQRHQQKTLLNLNLDGKEIFLNDLLKLLATINPDSEISQLEKENEQAKKADSQTKAVADKTITNNVPATSPFWPTGVDIAAQLAIEKLYYSDYMSYHNINGKLLMNDRQLHADDFTINFQQSPMKLNAQFQFQPNRPRPYNIDLTTTIDHFQVGKFIQTLDPTHLPRTQGMLDVVIKIYGDLSNLSQIRNELLFDLDIEGKDGVYNLIPADDIMLRSSGHAMAVVGEVVSVLPTSGFGLGIINRVVRFAKEINYDFIKLRLVRQADLNTTIERFQILGPELHLFAKGGITFKKNTPLFYQPLEMNAQLNLAGEGAAIFYGLGLLQKEQDEFGFWKGPEIKFRGTINRQQDNFNEIISKAKKGTLAGGITNPFSGLIGNYRYRWFGDDPDYSKTIQDSDTKQSKILTAPDTEEKIINIERNQTDSQLQSIFDENF